MFLKRLRDRLRGYTDADWRLARTRIQHAPRGQFVRLNGAELRAMRRHPLLDLKFGAVRE